MKSTGQGVTKQDICKMEKKKFRLLPCEDRLKSFSGFVATNLGGVGFLLYHGVKHIHKLEKLKILGKIELQV